MKRNVIMLISVLVLLVAGGCKSSSPETGFKAPRHHAELWGAINYSRERLDAVKAPRRAVFPYTIFSFTEASYRGCIPCTELCGWSVHPDTIDWTVGKHQNLPEHGGGATPEFWYPAIMHRWLGGTQKSDYHWINKALGACLPE